MINLIFAWLSRRFCKNSLVTEKSLCSESAADLSQTKTNHDKKSAFLIRCKCQAKNDNKYNLSQIK